ncbi:hypothetical protein G4V62_10160 [Bacillaceae bacterium SIJ1]|nr:hypothetical protein [Litoribacterium kuwaitense]NGP45301.1 hypothetical protein [Litoribacterium kuwaitense]
MSLPELKELLASYGLKTDTLLYVGINENRELEWSALNEINYTDPAIQ